MLVQSWMTFLQWCSLKRRHYDADDHMTIPNFIRVFLLLILVSVGTANALELEWTGLDLEIDGESRIPLGLWGVMSTEKIPNPKANGVEWVYHPWKNLRLSPPKSERGGVSYLLGIFEGKQPALQRISPLNWEAKLGDIFTRLPKAKQPFDFLANPKGWEDGYGINGYGKFFDRHKAKLGGDVTLDGKKVDGLQWGEPKWLLFEYNGKLRMDWTNRMTQMGDRFTMDEWFEPQSLKEGLKVKVKNQWAVLRKEWWAKDELPIPQRGVAWWNYNPKIWRSPQHVQNRKLFLELVEAWTKHPAASTLGKEVSFGWGAPWRGSENTQWKDMIQPMIELASGNLFHLSDRVRGESTDEVMAGYELAWNHSLNLRHTGLGFRTLGIEGVLNSTNPQGVYAEPPLKGSEEYEIGSFLYHIKDLLSRMMLMPHKAGYRFLASSEQGVGALAALDFLAPLKGTMVAMNVDDPMVLAVASRNGRENRIVLMNDHYRNREVRVGFSGHRFKNDQIKIIRPKLGGSFRKEEKQVPMTSLLNLELKPREVIQLVFFSEEDLSGKRVMHQFPMKGKPRRNIATRPLTFIADLDNVIAGDQLVLRLNIDRPVSAIKLSEGEWNQEINHLRRGLQDHLLTYRPKKGRLGFSLRASSNRALFEGASLFVLRELK